MDNIFSGIGRKNPQKRGVILHGGAVRRGLRVSFSIIPRTLPRVNTLVNMQPFLCMSAFRLFDL